ncbi:MAG: 1-(5-phosphoribosyl)-5-[(5-phosphoribosylamino)methylideneamino]imidazole-4-carboxamide isomerase [Oscillospiraceae bacterium]|jgi:phosphoribosylformimino-5-aminoimidazole carboxamide ribotide isomerase|nr:1-(5-phosphoribosyl)-5-[(5-phosphoribosylamino)methylideneamino]imidazole-4-carboxamide isomerase [Oscillospiraceae bacterium]
MILFPAIDLYEKKAVRLYKGDYDRMTVYSDEPVDVAAGFVEKGASHIHIVDLEGAKNGRTPNLETVIRIKRESGAFCEIGGGIRSMDVIDEYLSCGIDRVILGTSAVEDRKLLQEAVLKYGRQIAVGADIREGYISVKGWTENSGITVEVFFKEMQDAGVRTVICTDISRDGALKGTNTGLYRRLSCSFDMDIIASGGVSDLEDIKSLKEMGLYGAIIGKALYTGNIDLRKAVEVAE